MARKKQAKKSGSVNPAVIFSAGAIGTSKSTIQSEIVQNGPAFVFSNNWPDPRPKRIKCSSAIKLESPQPKGKPPIVVFEPSRSIDRNEQVLFQVATAARNCLIVIDDIRDWTNSTSQVKGGLAIIFGRCRKNNIDILVSCHHFNQLPSDLMHYKPHFLIHETTAKIGMAFQKSIRNFPEFQKVVNRVNSKASSNPFYCELYSPFA